MNDDFIFVKRDVGLYYIFIIGFSIKLGLVVV